MTTVSSVCGDERKGFFSVEIEMDPLAALRAEIEKKKAAARPGGTKRWRSVGEMEKERENAYLREEQNAEKLRNDRKRRKLADEKKMDALFEKLNNSSAAAGDKQGLQSNDDVRDTATSSAKERTGDPPLCKDEILKRLRFLKHPVTLFGEEAWDRFDRLRELELEREDGTEGQRNVFQTKIREMEAKDAENDLYEYNNAKLPHFESEKLPAGSEPVVEGEKVTCKEDYVHFQIRKYMNLWLSEINEMPASEKRARDGRQLAAKYETTKEWLKPLHKLLRKRKLSRDILNALHSIFAATANRDYVQANTLYLERLAIGNAPWPMGATMVGIHARAAREKIGEDKIAHVMNDERTRKYIQSIKRLITLAERHYPSGHW